MFRQQKNFTAAFRLPSPFNPSDGEHATLTPTGIYPYCAMMQIAEEDTEVDYVICRGFDIRMRVFIDYESGNADKPGIPVAKPYGSRRTGAYEIGQIFPAVLPLQTENASPSDVPWRVGQNPGVAATSEGHPADLDETVDELKTTGDIYIDWMLLDTGTSSTEFVELCLAENHPGQGIAFDAYLGTWDPSSQDWTYGDGTSVKAIDHRYGVPYPDAGATGIFTPRQSDDHGTIYECVSLDCDSAGPCSPDSSVSATVSRTPSHTASST